MWALRALCNVAVYEGRLAEAITIGEGELEIARREGDHVHASHSLVTHVLAHAYSGRRHAAMTSAGEQQAHADASGNPTQQAWACYSHGEVLRSTDPEAALDLFAEAVSVGEGVESNFVIGVALVSLASTRARLGHNADALRTFMRVVDHWHRRGDWAHQWTTLRNIAPLLHRLGHDPDAAILLGAVTGPDSGARTYGETSRELEALECAMAGRLGAEALGTHLERGRAMRPDEAVRHAKLALTTALEAAC
jgi:ATP/maltotriose-dependent transcriptional regulator MalT